MPRDKHIEEENFEALIKRSKEALERLNSANLTLKESLTIYKDGLTSLNKAQKLLEEAKLEYRSLSIPNPRDVQDND